MNVLRRALAALISAYAEWRVCNDMLLQSLRVTAKEREA